MKRNLLFFALLLSVCSFAEKSSVTILIDPGHGGEDPGHLPLNDSLAQEKVIALAISLKVGHYLTHNLQNVKIIYTRETDIYPSLDHRVNMAHEQNVDYMLSIHINGSDNPDAQGTETHIHDYKAKTSASWAQHMEKQFKKRAGRNSRGVKTKEDLGHSIQILKYTRMPTILVECGFITHAEEGVFLNSVYGQEIIASAIFRATRDFIKEEHADIDFEIPEPIVEVEPEPEISTEHNNIDKVQPGYKVQIMASIDPVEPSSSQFANLEVPVERSYVDTESIYKYKYYVGTFASKKDAKDLQKQVQDLGYHGAFVVFVN